MILALLLLVSNVNAAENTTDQINIASDNCIGLNEIDDNEISTNLMDDTGTTIDNQENNTINHHDTTKLSKENTGTNIDNDQQSTDENILKINSDETPLTNPPDGSYYNNQNGGIYQTQLTLSVIDTTSFNSTKNITINIHLDWNLYMNENYYNTNTIFIYENNNMIKNYTISELENAEYEHNKHQILDIPFNYTVKDRTELKATLLQIDSNILSFEEMKNITLTNLKNNSIIINNNYFSSEDWTNQIKYLQKAINEAPNNSIIHLNNITLVNDENITINIDKNITIIGNNTIINGLEQGTIFTIQPTITVTFINLTFTNTTTDYIIKNNGNLTITNTTFSNNLARIIINNGELILENTVIENTITNYYAITASKIETTQEKGVIYNTKTLILKNTTFNNIEIHPIIIDDKKIAWDAIIVNQDKTTITDSKFTNINYRTIYNNGMLKINNTLIENITSPNIISYSIQYTQKLNETHLYCSYKKTANSNDGHTIYNNNNLQIINTTFQKITGSNGAAIYNNNNLQIINTTFQRITGSNGAAIYNNNQTTILNTIFQTITGNEAIYTTGTLNINNTS